MSKHISYDEWLGNVLSHLRDTDGTIVDPCPRCKHDFDPACHLCDGASVIAHDEHGNKINVSISAYKRQCDRDKIRWRKHVESRNVR